MAEFIYPFPGPYYIVETKKDAEIRHDLCTASSNDYICISGPNVTPGITVYRRWGEGVEPENTHCWGDCYGAIIARFPPSSGPAGRVQALANAFALVLASKINGFDDEVPAAEHLRIEQPELED